MGGKDKIMKQKNKKKLDKWFTENYEWLRKEVGSNITIGKMSGYKDDLMSTIVEAAYKLPDEKVEQMLNDNMIKWWFLRSAGLQLRSSTSPFYTQFRRHKMSTREDGIAGSRTTSIFEREYEEYDASLELCFTNAYDELDFYLKALMDKHFYQKWSIQKIHKYYGISKTHVIKDLNRAINQIRNQCKEC